MQLSTSCVSVRHGPLQKKSVASGGMLIFPDGFNLNGWSQPT